MAANMAIALIPAVLHRAWALAAWLIQCSLGVKDTQVIVTDVFWVPCT